MTAAMPTRRKTMELRARYIVLLLLAEGPKTGYEIIKTIRSLASDKGGEASGLSPGTLYPLLRSLEEEGLVEAVEEPKGLRRRRVYHLTRRGVEKLLEMIQRGLDIMEASLQLHLRAARRLIEDGILQPYSQALVDIAAKLNRIEDMTRQLSRILQQAAQRRETAQRPSGEKPGHPAP